MTSIILGSAHSRLKRSRIFSASAWRGPSSPWVSTTRGLLGAMGLMGALLEERLAFLKPGEGGRFFLHLHALVAGLRQMADVPPATHEVLDAPHMAPLRVDFTRELTDSLATMLRGLEAR